jgi:hypothetical protein
MALICEEHEVQHAFTDVRNLFCVTTAGVEMITAVCRNVVRAIPEELRSDRRFRGSIDIYAGYSGADGRDGELSIRHFVQREYKFSISRKTAELYLPKSIKNRY